MLLIGLDPPLRGELIDFALGDHRRSMAENTKDLQASILDHQFESPGKEEVADQDARRIAPNKIRGPLAPAHSRPVDDIVVKQSRGVDELDSRGELVVARAGIAQQAAASERKHRAHALAAPGDQMTRELRNQRYVALHPFEDDGIHAIHVARDERHHRVQRGSALRCKGMNCCDHGAAPSGDSADFQSRLPDTPNHQM